MFPTCGLQAYSHEISSGRCPVISSLAWFVNLISTHGDDELVRRNFSREKSIMRESSGPEDLEVHLFDPPVRPVVGGKERLPVNDRRG